MRLRWPRSRKHHPGRAALDQWRENLNYDWSIELNDEVSSTYFVECNTNSLDTVVSYGGRDAGHMLDHLYSHLIACTNVRSLSLTIFQGGCEIDDTNPRSFEFRNGDNFPQLENLTLSGYDWDARKTTPWWASQMSSSLQSWRVAMDWSKVKHLDIDLPPKSFLEVFSGPDQLAELESLKLRPKLNFWGDGATLCGSDENTKQLRQDYTSFITTLPPLRRLDVCGMGRLLDLEPILEAHGESLKSLSLHEYESDCKQDIDQENWTRPTLNVSQLHHLFKAAPHLETMALDLHRSRAEWPAATFKALSAFENLRNLNLHFDLEDHTKTKPVKRCAIRRSAGFCTVPELMQPTLDQDAAQQIFHEIRSLQPGKKLQHMTLYAGDYGREEGGGMRIAAHYEHNRPVKFDCSVAEDGVEDCQGWIGRNVDDGYDDPSDHDGYPKPIAGALKPGESGGKRYSADLEEDQKLLRAG